MSHLRLILITLSLLLSLTVNAQYDFSEVDKLLLKGSLSPDAVVLVYKKGKIIYQKEQGLYDINTQKAIGSCGKWLVSALVMTFVDEGKLSLEDTIGKFLPEFTAKGKGSIKIKHCLTHTTGLESPPFLIEVISPKQFISLKDEVAHMAANYKVHSAPGKEFKYSGIGLNIAGRILEVISKQGFDTIFQKRIARPLGMKHTTFQYLDWPINPSGVSLSSAHDYSQFLLMCQNKGTYKGKRILSKTAIAAMETPVIPATDIKEGPSAAKYFSYGLGVWISEFDNKKQPSAICCPGIFGTWPIIDRKLNYISIFFESRLIDQDVRDECLELKKAIDQQLIKTK